MALHQCPFCKYSYQSVEKMKEHILKWHIGKENIPITTEKKCPNPDCESTDIIPEYWETIGDFKHPQQDKRYILCMCIHCKTLFMMKKG